MILTPVTPVLLASAVVNLEIDQLAMHEYLNQLNSNYTKVIWDMNDTVIAAIGNSSMKCRKQHHSLRKRLDNITASQAVLNRTVVNITRTLKSLVKRVGNLWDRVDRLAKNQRTTRISSQVNLC